ncbi:MULTISPECIES: DUF3289 family protein [Bacteroidaceae]|uniref:DUF3289 family protein n=1 Tax=Phocaeicola barnesiae TaxID=376804 RepID=A0AAW5N0U9_9BACT|nr:MULTISPECIES: DUF3289 family protein [Bacteroidaceae]MBM6671226.1 DUF3289 family protein [Phocaeicola coprophilus]MBM6718988.1 DUF3289 family protein [Bacteroides gallinaceum]MBM6782622.1 DUF3289 family protein [Bacteroides mediterraneensis]MCR8874401.1 DUF3289 family protein [Phocaeicola barnesiae]
MASEILLEINGHTYHALRFCYEFYRYTDVKGKPVTGLEGGDIHVVLESNADNSLLETMLSDKSRQVPYHSWPDFEPAPICGKIQLIRDDVEVFRELVFEEGYIYRYHESMMADGYPMSILLSISTMRLDINRNVRLDRRLLTTYGFGWMKLGNTVFKQVVKLNQSIQPPKKSTTHQEEPVVLVTSVKGESKAIVSQTVQYVVTKYNVPNVKDSDRKRVKWVIEVDGQKEYLKEQGETLDLQIKEEWQGKEITVMPYLKQCTYNVSVHTKVERWYLPRVIVQTKTKEGFGDKQERNIYEYEDAYGNGLTEASTKIAIDMHWGDQKNHTNNFTTNQITDNNVLKNIQNLNKKSDKELFAIFKRLIKLTSRGELEKQNILLVNHLEQHINLEYKNDILTKNVFSREITNEFINYIKQGIILEIKNKSGDLNKADFRETIKHIKRPNFNVSEDRLRGLTIAIHDIWGFRISMEMYSFNPNKKECMVKVRYRFFDHFGLDLDDIINYGSKEKIMKKMGVLGILIEEFSLSHPSQGLPLKKSGLGQGIAEDVANGFCAWFILQHLRGYKPFVTVMENVEIFKFNI